MDPGRISGQKVKASPGNGQDNIRMDYSAKFSLHSALRMVSFFPGLSDGVTVAHSPLEAIVLVRIQVGQPLAILGFGILIADGVDVGGHSG